MKKILILCTLLMVGCKKEMLVMDICGKVTEVVEWNGKKYVHISLGKDEIAVEVQSLKGITVGETYCSKIDFRNY